MPTLELKWLVVLADCERTGFLRYRTGIQESLVQRFADGPPPTLRRIGIGLLFLLLALYPKFSLAQQQPLDSLVQAPELKAPERGSLVGTYASTAFTAGEMSRGVFLLPAGFVAPQDRGPLLANVFPSYSPENTISEWGMGWSANLAILRTSIKGDIAYDTDEFTSPYGRLVTGSDGRLYPIGLGSSTRVEWHNDTFIAYLADGSRAVFGRENRVSNRLGTYAWYLTEVVSSLGRRTHLWYERNPSGRLFLSRVEYGGTGNIAEYQIVYDYEPVETTFEDFIPGEALVLDRRVKRVTMFARRSDIGDLEERWHYDLSYRSEGLPAFYLTGIQQMFRSGDQPPALTFDYHMGMVRLAASRFERDASLADALKHLGRHGFQPDKSAFLDLDEDGRVDIESGRDNTLYLRTNVGFSVQDPPPVPLDVHSGCRQAPNPHNTPRTLVQMLGTSEHYVFSVQTTGDHLISTVDVCQRDGKRLWSQDVRGDWKLSPTVRLADLDRDHRPEIVRVSSGRYHILPNVSTPDKSIFGPAKTGELEPAFVPDTAWVHDFNGDSIPDLVARYSGGLMVWSGKGHLEFERVGRRVQFWSAAGPVYSVRGYDLTFVDANKDGLADVLITAPRHNTASLFINEGYKSGLAQSVVVRDREVAGLREVDPYMSRPMAIDLAGSGNTSVVYTRGSEGFTIVLAGPETGLLRTADDGRGTVLHFEYGRTNATPGAQARQAVLQRLVVESSGYDTVAYEYQYANPQLHSQGKFLLGYDRVVRKSSLAEDSLEFLNDDRYSGILTKGIYRDLLVPSVYKLEERIYEERFFLGIPWKRLLEQKEGWVSAAPNSANSVMEGTIYHAYTDEICPSRVEKNVHAGKLMTTTEFAHPSSLSLHMTCLASIVIQEGRHTDSRLDFRHEVQTLRNDVGLVTEVARIGDNMKLILQEIDYDKQWRITELRRPGAGRTQVTWEGNRDLHRVITSPDGSEIAVAGRNVTTDAILSLRTTHGLLVHNQFFRFDGLERLVVAWDDMGTGSENNPDLTYAYRYASATQPGAVTSSQLVDASTGSRREAIDLLTAAGEPLVTATRHANTWAFGELVARSRTKGETTYLFRPAIAASTSPLELNMRELFEGRSPTDTAWSVTKETKGIFGFSTQRNELIQKGVLQSTRAVLDIDVSGSLARRLRENDEFENVTTMDAAGHVLSFRDQAGATYLYTYDALGRFRGVVLPDAKHHLVQFDGHGRTSRIDRTDVGSIEYSYSEQTGLLVEKRYLSNSGSARRTLRLTYDGAGRVVEETYQDTKSGATRGYKYLWDGTTPSMPESKSATGFLTGVVSDGFVKELTYYPDGKLMTSSLSLEQWRRIEATFKYSDAGTVVESNTTVSSLGTAGHVLETTLEQNFFDALGRLERVMRNRAPLAVLSYSDDGLPIEARLPDDVVASTVYDSFTRRPVRTSIHQPDFDAQVSRRYNRRAFAEMDEITIGRFRIHRNYHYTPQGFLASSQDQQHRYDYHYNEVGLPTAIITDGTVRELARAGSVMMAGDVEYRFDDLGRVVQRGDLSLVYGPDGQLSMAQRSGVEWSFAYDERGQRLLKRAQSKPIAAYLEGGYLGEDGLTETFSFAGRPVALSTSAGTHPLVTDFIGTVLAENDGYPRPASPYGERDVRPASSAIADFAAKGYDSDLGLVRMGVRDYDPLVGQWYSPDVWLLEDLGIARDQPVETAGLWTYARGNPVNIVDPLGMLGLDTIMKWFGLGKSSTITPTVEMGLSAAEAVREPRWISIARGELGVKEVWKKGKQSGASLGGHDRILEYHSTTHFLGGGSPNSERAAWCSSFVNWVMEKSDIQGTDSPMAISWADWGDALSRPAVGAIGLVEREGKHHVGIIIGRKYDPNEVEGVVLLGGNQSNAVTEKSFYLLTELKAIRWPSGTEVPWDAYLLPTIQGRRQSRD